jgi:hypothetical protein
MNDEQMQREPFVVRAFVGMFWCGHTDDGNNEDQIDWE